MAGGAAACNCLLRACLLRPCDFACLLLLLLLLAAGRSMVRFHGQSWGGTRWRTCGVGVVSLQWESCTVKGPVESFTRRAGWMIKALLPRRRPPLPAPVPFPHLFARSSSASPAPPPRVPLPARQLRLFPSI
ncbi:hypothetical protein DFH27DRAFT_559776 [Peziza echinospora]|nr:hypothetical protein DFH27DRAFT_559776 [Peziza echinospora]